MSNELFEFKYPIVHTGCCDCPQCQRQDVKLLRELLDKANRIDGLYSKMRLEDWHSSKYKHEARKRVQRAARVLETQGYLQDWTFEAKTRHPFFVFVYSFPK